MQQQEITLLLAGEDLDAAQGIGRKAKVAFQIVPKKQFIEPVTAVLIGGGILAIAKFVLDLIEHFRGGVLIQVQADGQVSVRREKKLPAGWTVVETANGTVSIDVHDSAKDGTERILEKLVEGSLKSADDIVDAAKDLGLKLLRGKPSPAEK